MTLIATTQGLGPYYPKIIFEDVVYIYRFQYDSEDDAQRFAQDAVDELTKMGNYILMGMAFERKTTS